MSVSLRTLPDSERDRLEADIAGKWADLSPRLDERSRRLWLGTEAKHLGYGGIKFVAEATGAAIETVRGGQADLAEEPEGAEEGGSRRVRRPGGGRKKAEDRDPELPAALGKLMDEESAADPMTPRLRWTSKSLGKLSGELTAQGHDASPTKVRGLLRQAGWRLQSNNKSVEKKTPHEDRDPQFRYINRLASAFIRAGQPVVSIDTKKKELVGNFANGGREWAPAGQAPSVLDHDFPSWAEGKAIPYGIYDLAGNEGFVSVGTDHDTPAFAVASLESWWVTLGRARYPDATRLLITADSGGSNAAASRGCKKHLAAFAERHGLEEVTVLHYPSGTSKWNKVEHRLFSFISINWRGKPLTSYETVLELIGATTTRTGLTVTACHDTGIYPTGQKVSDKEMRQLEKTRITRHGWHPEWNYTIHGANKPED
ncbi:MAG TPA: ISAzo13 family transposase [Streptosporangiaceae bacterium]|nr:ISAzo13 family transposase [Streptosporangiaceae bacterium]